MRSRIRPGVDADRGSSGPRVLVILGPTATGKTAVAVEVARGLNGEVISADSRAFFTGLDVVTAKPGPAERAGVPHHGLDVVAWNQPYDAMAFRRDVSKWVPEIVGRGRVPILAGGGTLYIGAVIRGLFEGPSKNTELRAEMNSQEIGALYERLIAVDPDAARAIHPNDRLRIERALEVFVTTGRRISSLQPLARPLAYRFVSFGLRLQRDVHRASVAARVRQMIEAGLLDEVRRLREAGLRPEHQAYRTIGIPEMVAVLDGAMSLEEAAAAMTAQTWALAKRQQAWFRRDRQVHWVDVTGRPAAEIGAGIVARWKENVQ